MLLKELDAYAALGEALHQAAQVVEVARQTIHAVHHDRVAFAHEGEQPFQFGPPCVLARRLVGEHFIHLDLFERHCCKVSDEAAFCLIQRPYISKTLLTRRISPRGSP